MRKLLPTILLIFAVSVSFAQTGGRKKEHKNQRGGGFHLFRKGKGNAGAFAKGHSTSKKGFFARLFSGEKVTAGGWVYKKTPGSHKTDHSLFHRYRTKNKVFKDKLQARINRQRAKNRVRGNSVFGKRKY